MAVSKREAEPTGGVAAGAGVVDGTGVSVSPNGVHVNSNTAVQAGVSAFLGGLGAALGVGAGVGVGVGVGS